MWPIQLIKPDDANFPEGLKKLARPPKQLYYRGNWKRPLFKKALSIVGSRRLTRYGQLVIEKFVSFLVGQQITTVSGFMYGADSEVHRQTLDNNGQTIAVLGSGLDIIYPPENKKLYQEILIQGGLIISEYEADFQPQLWTFPQRNRLVAALGSLGTLIIEAGNKSGSLITARLAHEQGKKVFAIPGPITSSVSRGTNLLIQNHLAEMVLEPGDILGQKTTQTSLFQNLNLTPLERKIIQLLETEPLSADEIAVHLNKSIVEISKTLSLMSLRAIITEFIGKYYLPISSPK
ncbi:MAG: DNA-processing protein DprA [Candidatus Shapirobacteria bacterium]